MRHLVKQRQYRKSAILSFGFLLIFVLMLASSRAWADDNAQSANQNTVRAVRLSDVEGDVQVLQDGQTVFDQAHQNMPVMEGMQLKTGSDGRVEVQFEDGSVARLTPNSSISLDQLGRNQDGTTVTVIGALSGLSYYELNGQSGQYTVHLGPDTVTAADSSIFRVDIDQNPGTVAVTHGTVHIENGQGSGFDVRTNQTASIDLHDPANYDVADSVAANSWDQWNSDRDQQLARMDASETTARGGTGSPDDPAWSDLDYYGDWYDVPGYGMGWSPAGVGAGFDPFGAGYWGYYNSIGYTWISSYPWGWWPYHCGAWNYFNNNGWMWFPGGCGYGAFGGGWYPYASVWNVPQNYHPPGRPPVVPLHGKVHMPRQNPMVAVNRTPGQRFRGAGEPKPESKPLHLGDNTIQPIVASVHPHYTGPTGDSFTSTVGSNGFVDSRPGEAGRGVPGIGMGMRGGFPVGSSGARLTYVPGGVHALPSPPRYSPPPTYHAPVNREGEFRSGGGGGAPAPHYSAPAMSAPHASSPSGGGSTHR